MVLENEITLIFTAILVAYFLLSCDELILFWFSKRKRVKPICLSQKEVHSMCLRKEKSIALLIPAWHEDNVIRHMLLANLRRINYRNFQIFVGVYPNDPDTFREVTEVSKQDKRVALLVNPLNGPTSKGQILNFMIEQINKDKSNQFDLYLFHDAEDIIHPLSFKLFNVESDQSDFVQIPVFAVKSPSLSQVGSLYLDEFAVSQLNDLLIRKSLGLPIPSTGVGFCLTKKALHELTNGSSELLFDETCLTEDYLLGLSTHKKGIKQSFPCRFLADCEGQDKWIATWECFPRTFLSSAKQKARWIQGISFQSFRELGWFGSLLNCCFLFRDRKAVLAHTVNLAGILLLPFFFVNLEKISISSFFVPILLCNAVIFVLQFRCRQRNFKTLYGDCNPLLVLSRYFGGIFVNGISVFIAIFRIALASGTKKGMKWVKTTHELPISFQQVTANHLSLFFAIIVLLTGTFCVPALSETCIQVFFDSSKNNGTSQKVGKIHSIFTLNLLGHFPRWKPVTAPIETYQEGQLERCPANIFIGTNFHAEIPKSFLSDFLATKNQVLWLGYHLWKLNPEELTSLFGVNYRGLTDINNSAIDEKGRPHFFKYYHYKGQVFEKYGEFSKKDPRKFNASFEVTELEPVSDLGPDIRVLAWAEHSQSKKKIPYVLVNKNHWYFADSPFSFITEKDRYLIFTDLLFDFLGEKPRYPGKRPALVRLEDIHPNIPIWQLKGYFDLFRETGIPFSISLIPVFSDPFMVQVDDPTEKVIPITQRPSFVDLLVKETKSQGSIILHGITHQYRKIKNPFNGMSGDDFEFWDGVNNRPIPEDSISHVIKRLHMGWKLLRTVKINPVAWLTPHYQASALDFVLFGQLFSWNIGRVVYVPSQITSIKLLPTHLKFNVNPNVELEEHLGWFQDLRVQDEAEVLPSGQFFPFEIEKDFYGQKIIPENLGNIQPFLNEQVFKTQDFEDMLSCARRNLVLRDHWASFFLHPVLIQRPRDEGVAAYPGDNRKLVSFMKEIETLGYQFIDLKDWISEHSLEK